MNGEDASECEWKWQVGLWKSSWGPFCGGTLIADNWVLTAAHCVTRPDFYVVAGDWKTNDVSDNQQRLQAAQVFRHPGYNSRNMTKDYALVKLQGSFELTGCVGTACLPEEGNDLKPGQTCWITGWGTLSAGGSQPRTLQEASVNIISNTDCVNNFNYQQKHIDSTMICAQGKTADGQIKDACQGDSGGPLVCEDSGKWSIYGATSWGFGCAGATYPGIWSRVHEVLEWVDDTMNGN